MDLARSNMITLPNSELHVSPLCLVGNVFGWSADVNNSEQVLENFNVSLGNGLGKIQGKVFRIGHLDDFNAPILLGTLGYIGMGLELARVPFKPEGVRNAMDELLKN